MSEHIKEYWESQGVKHGDSHWASWGDNWMIDLEIETIGAHINDGDTVIDIGCANGYSTFCQSEKHRLTSIVGVDYAESMISEAQRSLASKSIPFPVSFSTGDIRNLKFESSSFDVGYTTRVLINLPTWEEQKLALTECIRVVKPGGKLIISEGFWEPLCLLNAMRALSKLEPLVEHDFNRYLKFAQLKPFLKELDLEFEIEDFSSIYYLGSRFLRELVTDIDKYEGFSNPINEIFYNIEKKFSGGGFGIQQALIIKK